MEFEDILKIIWVIAFMVILGLFAVASIYMNLYRKEKPEKLKKVSKWKD